MRRRSFLTFACLLIAAPSFAAYSIENLIDVPVPIRIDGGRYSIEEVRTAIIKGSHSRLWTAASAGDRTIRANLNVKNKHFAVVEITYSESSYSIVYVSSENLDYKPEKQTIHRNYRKWVLQLSTSINREFHALELEASQSNSARDGSDRDTEDLFDELLKLDELRDRGILTDEEFEVEKRKLLDRN